MKPPKGGLPVVLLGKSQGYNGPERARQEGQLATAVFLDTVARLLVLFQGARELRLHIPDGNATARFIKLFFLKCSALA